MKSAIAIITLCFALLLPAETLDALKARLVAEGTVVATGNTDVGVALAVDDATGQRTLNECRVRVTITTDAAGSQRLTSMLVLVYDLGLGTEEAHVSDAGVHNYSAPAGADRAPKELLYEGRQALIMLRDTATPIPSAPTAELPLVVNESEWHGQIITKYSVRKDSHSVAGISGSVCYIYLSTSGRVNVFIWVNSLGQFVVDPYED